MREDTKGLYVRGQLWVKGDKRIEDAVRAHNLMRGTGPKGLSIGYRVKDFDIEEFEGGVVTKLKEIDLFEVSVVGFAMNPKADVTAVKSIFSEDGGLPSKREVEKGLRDLGFSTKQAQTFISKGYVGLSRDAEKEGEKEQLNEILKSLKNLSNNLLKG